MNRHEIDTRELFAQALAKYADNDSGAQGKALEIALRYYIQPASKRNGRVTPNNTAYNDLRMRIENERGKRYSRIEIKSACGELGITDSADDLPNLLKGADYVIYAPEINASIEMEEQAFVFTRSEFIAFITGYPGRGQLLRVKTATNGETRVSFQSFYSESRPKASKPISEYIWDTCYNQPTVAQWLEGEEA